MSYHGTYYGTRQQQVLDSRHVQLVVRQQPRHALVTTDGKEKLRKPIDPPPIVEIGITQQHDPQQDYLVSPYLFMYATLVPGDVNEIEDYSVNGNDMLGQCCSSLHRLKDMDNQGRDGGFFVFGDLSVRKLGYHRLKFGLYDVRGSGANHVCEILSDPFEVLLPKDFMGMEESSYLSRAFSDQGVRLRLRKETRGGRGNGQGSYQASPPRQVQHASGGALGHGLPHHNPYNDTRGIKRQRSDTEFDNDPNAYAPAQVARFQQPFGNMQYHSQSYMRQEERVSMSYNQMNVPIGRSTHPTQPEAMGSWEPVGRSTHPAQPETMGSWEGVGRSTHPAQPETMGSWEPVMQQNSAFPDPYRMHATAGAVQRPSNYFGGHENNNVGQLQQTQATNHYGPPAHTTSDAYGSVPGLRTPTSLTDAGVTGYDQSYAHNSVGGLPTNPHTSNPASTMGSSQPRQQYPTFDGASDFRNSFNTGVSLEDQASIYETTAYDAAPHSSTLSNVSASGSVSQQLMLTGSMPQSFLEETAAYPTPNH